MLRNEPAFLEAMLIARFSGCYSCPINWHYKADEAGYILRDSGAKGLIVHADLLRQIEGGVPPGCHVIVVEPSRETRAAFGSGAQCAFRRARPSLKPGLRPRPPTRGAAPGYGSIPCLVRHHGQAKASCGNRSPKVARVIEWQTALGIKQGMRTAVIAPLYHSAPASYGMHSLMHGEAVLIHERFEGRAASPTSSATGSTGSISCRRISCACCACPTR